MPYDDDPGARYWAREQACYELERQGIDPDDFDAEDDDDDVHPSLSAAERNPSLLRR